MRSKHSLLMLLCCLVPIGVLFALPLLGVGPSSLSYLAVILLCPLLHFLMLRRGGGHQQTIDASDETSEAEAGDERQKLIKEKGIR